MVFALLGRGGRVLLSTGLRGVRLCSMRLRYGHGLRTLRLRANRAFHRRRRLDA